MQTDEKEFSLSLPLFTELKSLNFLQPGSSFDSEEEYDVYILFRHPTDTAVSNEKIRDIKDQEGDSGFKLPFGLTELKSVTGDNPPKTITFKVFSNSFGRLSKVYSRVTAESFGDARSMVNDHFGVILTRMCFLLDAPITLKQTDVIRIRTQEKVISLVIRGKTREFNPKTPLPEIKIGNDFFRAAFALYRQGLSSTDPYAAFGYFYRVAEGVFKIRGTYTTAAKKRGLSVERAKEKLEDIDEIGKDYPELIGLPINKVYQKYCTEYRTLISHFVADNGKILAVDQLIQEDPYWKLVPIIRQIARKLLINEWEFRNRWPFNEDP